MSGPIKSYYRDKISGIGINTRVQGKCSHRLNHKLISLQPKILHRRNLRTNGVLFIKCYHTFT